MFIKLQHIFLRQAGRQIWSTFFVWVHLKILKETKKCINTFLCIVISYRVGEEGDWDGSGGIITENNRTSYQVSWYLYFFAGIKYTSFVPLFFAKGCVFITSFEILFSL